MKEIDFKFLGKPGKGDVLVLPVFNNTELGNNAADFDTAFKGLISHNMNSDGKFSGKRGQTLSFAAPKNSSYKKVLLLGVGNPEALDKSAFRMLGGLLLKALNEIGHNQAEVVMDTVDGMEVSQEDAAAHLANGVLLKSYRFDKYKAVPDADKELTSLRVISNNSIDAAKKFLRMDETAKGSFLAADFANEAPNILYPESYAQQIDETLTPLGVTVRILDEKEMADMGMNAALAVGQGSKRPPRVVVMEYDGTDGSSDETPLALVGKGVTFDSGGLSIKPGAGMEEMKMDMGGSAAVVGTMHALAARKAKVKVVGIVGLAENMPGGNAYRPSDIFKSMGGKSIQVINTDAEGRLVLADILTYVQKTYDPKHVIDLATLTGAAVVALGHTYAAVFSEDDKLWKKLDKAGQKTGEEVWRLPLHKDFAKSTEGKITDLNNTGGRWGGASSAAEFLHAHIDEGRSWAHIDMAGPGMPADGVSKGFGVRLLEQLIHKHFEEKEEKKAHILPATAPVPTPGK